MKRKHKKPVGPIKQMLHHAAEAEAKKIAREHGCEALWELYLIDAYRRVAGLPPVDYAQQLPQKEQG